jgi:hypothetical protein
VISKWLDLHWVTRISILSVLVAILSWQSRFIWSIANPMYGWPMPFNNIWYQSPLSWCASILIQDIIIWFIIATAVGYTIEHWVRKNQRWQFYIISLIKLQTVVAVVFVLGCIEKYLRTHLNNESMTPKYVHWNYNNISIWFDIGLFTDPPQFWPLNRIIIIFGIGCVVYIAGYILLYGMSHILTIGKRLINHHTQQTETYVVNSQVEIEGRHSSCPTKDPLIARVVIWILFTGLIYFILLTLHRPVAVT